MRDTVIEVEYPLIEAQLGAIDDQLERAIGELNWTTEGGNVLLMSASTELHERSRESLADLLILFY